MTSQAGADQFLSDVLNIAFPALFAAVPFNDGPDSDNGLFYRVDKWEFVSASYIPTGLRDIAEYTLRPRNSSQQLRIYSLHLKASAGYSNEQQRLTEATTLRTYLNALPAGTNFIIAGDYNIYTSDEPAWQRLLASETNNNGRAFDPLNLVGNWTANATFAQYHTQSPRVRSFGGGATGGLDDRFDIMLTSSSMAGSIITSSYQAFGNDGNHFNDSINRLPNTAVPDSIANALHYASDHLPLTAKFLFQRAGLPVQLVSFTASMNGGGDSVLVKWRTLNETNNFGFEVQRRSVRENGFQTLPNSFVPGHGTTLEPHNYRFVEPIPSSGNWFYRLRQIDLDGTVHYSDPAQINVVAALTEDFVSTYSISQNYPNPFNPTTQIRFSVPSTTHLSLVIYDLLGREVASLFSGIAEQGREYSVTFDANTALGAELPSGVYYYRLRQNGSTSASFVGGTKRMVLLR
jgi:hypothetical protein